MANETVVTVGIIIGAAIIIIGLLKLADYILRRTLK